MDDNTKIVVKADVNKGLTQIGNGLGAIPILGDLFLKQAHRKYISEQKIKLHASLSEQQIKQYNEDIDNKLAYFDIDKNEIVYFNEIEDPRIRAATRKEALKEIRQEKILDYVLEELENKNIKLEDMVIGVDTDYLNEEFLPYWDKYSDDMRRADLQNLWAKILVQEMQNPHTISIRTMEFVKTLSTRDANIFNMILPYVIDNNAVPKIYNILREFDLQHLEHLGLLIGRRSVILEKGGDISFGKYRLKTDEFQFSCYTLSDIGQELYLIAGMEDCDFDKLEESFDYDDSVEVGDIMTFHHLGDEPECEPIPFRIYNKKEDKKGLMKKNIDLPILSLEPNI